MLKFAKRTIVILSVTMVAGAPAAVADTKAPPKSTKSTTPTTNISLNFSSMQYTYTPQR